MLKYIYFGKGHLFVCTTFPGPGKNTFRVKKCFFWARDLLAQKSDFGHTTPNFDIGPFVTLGEAIHFKPLERFFDFSCPSYGHFRKKKKNLADASKSLPPPHCTVGAPSASNSPSALSEQALRARALCARAG